jgi:hypothetical protein
MLHRYARKYSDQPNLEAANVRRLMQEETMGSIATVFSEETEHAGMQDPFCMVSRELC